MKEILNILKKDPGVNVARLKNREKAAVIDAVKDRYPLPQLLKCLCMPKSSYYYQKSVMKQNDKYKELRKQIRTIFYDNRNCYGYRRIQGKLKNMKIIVSEKVVRRIMKEDKLIVYQKRK